MADQSFLDGIRAQAGMGMSYTRPALNRSQDQNSTQSGNPGYSANMPMPNVNYQQPPMSWQQQVMARQQQGQQIAQDPTNINYIQPMAAQFQNYGGPQGAMDPSMAQNAMGAMSGLAAQRNLRGGGMSALGVNMGMNPNAGPQQSMFTQPRPVLNRGPNGALQQMMGGNGFSRLGGGPIPRNLAAGPSGYRFVRPMMR